MPISLPVDIKSYTIRRGSKMEVFYPLVLNLQDKRLERNLNQTIVHQVQALIDKEAGDMPSTIVEMLGSYEIKNNQRDVLSLTLSNYAYHDHAAHGMTYLKGLTFDLRNKKLCKLEDLFKAGSDYIKKLSNMVHEQIKQRDIPILGSFTQIKPDQDFYVADKALVIYFQLYDITPYAFGFPMFPISVYEIWDIIV
ncbi:DUF3298 and DUF4163 domain-containing protein [Bacillus sp. USDA818B3_A]|uniref:DUF3298 and DUF4163 domain-containing protein n=1 Tax=Bacillus sp. USDA818B3_A TaxID=2698834 RepID=UPI001369491F|nr:DUF3298 and DUF4163 domain-containing protein [Bacillus sp. USDA818B3_A]